MGMTRRPSAAAWATGFVAAATLLGTATFGIAATTTAAAAAAPQSAATAAGPSMRLVVAASHITAQKYGKYPVFFEPGIWVASFGTAFQVNVSRASYTSPITATQVIRTANGTIQRRLPSSVLAVNWAGLRHFVRLTLTNSRGKVLDSSLAAFCPDGYPLAKATPNSATTSPYPSTFGGCGSGDPFPVGEVWGIARGWAVEPVNYTTYRMYVGTYTFTESITPQYVRLFHISPRDASATVHIKVVAVKQCCGFMKAASKHVRVPAHFVLVNTRHAAAHQPVSPSAVPLLTHVPADALPDLIPLPSWGIAVQNTKKESYLDFGATVWISGNGPLDVEGFRTSGSGTMKAYQYFSHNGKIVGRARVGTMGFANYNSWHFQQFAQYKLLNARKKVVVSSHKIGFCIAPTDSVDLVLRNATWQPSYTGIAGNCGDPATLSVAETLPVGWGDTYIQSVPYQSFDISELPNGVYFIEIIANPEHLLYETNRANDISLRKIIISGTALHRHVRVPAWHGLDPENGTGFFGL
jgi:hypothetical protein